MVKKTGKTKKDEFFVYPLYFFKMMFITCISNLVQLCEDSVEHVLADGTFSYCPEHFTQLYTIHVYRHGFYTPVVHVALPGKNKEDYYMMWTLLENMCFTLCGKVLNIRSLILDYEIGAILAAEMKFADITVTGCRFHLAQSWYKWIRNHRDFDVHTHYLDPESDIGKWLRTFFGLSFLPASMVGEAFALLESLKPSSECDKFSDYILKYYIGDMKFAEFPPELWARQITDIRDIRTTNGPEAFHRVYNSKFAGSGDPNIYKVLNVLLLNQEKSFLTFTDLKNGEIKKQDNRQTSMDKNVRKVWNTYLDSPRSSEDLRRYLATLGNRYKGKKL